MEFVKMFWYRSSSGKKNFGDELGPFLVRELSGANIKYIPIVNQPFKTLALYLLKLKQGSLKLKDYKEVFHGLGAKNVLFSVGSIIGYNGSSSSNIWGTGLIDSKAKIHNANFLAVRGKYTQERISELGFNAPKVLGDPALLLPIILSPNISKKYKIGIIPHHIHYTKVASIFKQNKDVLVIDLTEDIEKVVNSINSCERTISSSLHGIIVSHAYNVPCLWCNFSDKKLSGDGIKFKDYFSSVNIKEYSPFNLDFTSEINVNSLKDLVDTNTHINKIDIDLSQLQSRLLSVAPFPIHEKYRKFVKD